MAQSIIIHYPLTGFILNDEQTIFANGLQKIWCTFANESNKIRYMAHHHHEKDCCESKHHHHGEHHHHHHGLKSQIITIVAATLLLSAAVVIEHTLTLPTWQLLLVYLIPYLVAGAGTLKEAAEGLLRGDTFNEHFLMSIATIGALAIGFMPGAEPEFTEAVFVMLFFQVGEMIEGYAEGRSRRSIEAMMSLRPDRARVVRKGEELEVSPDEVGVGETIVVCAGERIPIDGIIEAGRSSLNTSALTGESLPRDVAEGDEAVSGCINLSGELRIRTTQPFAESTVMRVIDLVAKSSERKSKSETFITRFARVYTPVVVYAALALALLPPLIMGDFAGLFATWLHRALIFLVVSCPCALVLSVPLTFFGGIGAASRNGILIKGGNYIDALSHVGTVVFDKTGTLTQGTFSVVAVHPERCDERRLLHLAAHVEHHSSHPIAAALREAFPEADGDDCIITQAEELAGLGIRARVGDETVCVGNGKMMESIGADWHECHETGTIVHIAIDGTYAGHIVIGDSVKPDSEEAIRRLKGLGVDRCVMLSGDRTASVEKVAQMLDIDEWHAELMPADKSTFVENQRNAMTEERLLAFVGDGINDAPTLASADIGIAMGAMGSDAAIEAADIVLMNDKPTKIATAISIARHTISIAHQNVGLAIGVKMAVLLLAAVGIATMWMAVFADVGVTVLAVLNALRAMRWHE